MFGVFAALTTSRGEANELGLPEKVLAALDSSDSRCAKIMQPNVELQYVYKDGFHAARSGGKLIRFFTASATVPFTGNAIIVENGNVTRQVVDVAPCTSVAVREKNVASEGARPVVTAVSNEQGVDPVTVRPIAQTVSSGKTAKEAPSFSEALKTANVTYSRFASMGNSEKERDGHNLNVKVRYQPFRVGNLTYGAYASFSDGSADSVDRRTGRMSTSAYRTVGGGFSGEYDHGQHMTSMIDVGLLYQTTDGATPAKGFSSRQEEWQSDLRYALASKYRRENGEYLFPYWEVGAHWIHQLSADYSDSKGGDDVYDNSHINIFGNLDLYDWYLTDTNAWRITPAINGKLGYLWGKDDGYFQGGPGLKVAFFDQEAFEFWLSPRWMFEGGDNRLYQIGTVKVDNLIRAAWSSEVKEKK